MIHNVANILFIMIFNYFLINYDTFAEHQQLLQTEKNNSPNIILGLLLLLLLYLFILLQL